MAIASELSSSTAAQATEDRAVVRVVRGQPTSDGAGVRLTRVIGGPSLPDLDPFLMLDEFRSDTAADYLAGFPDHPHRGFETVTYMLAGRMRHGDHMGNTGLLGPGSVQWMTAGRGIVHSEMPEQEDGLMWGFQLWVNLPARDKMTAPRYQDIPADRMPVVKDQSGAVIKVIAGRYGDAEGPVQGIVTAPLYLDVHLPAGTTARVPVARGHAGFTYVYEGAVDVAEPSGPRRLERGQLGVLGPGDALRVSSRDAPAKLILVAGRPLGEPVVKYGPFVMNSEAEIMQAIEDYQSGRF
jgi:quercetin 2,3-dioxygenase